MRFAVNLIPVACILAVAPELSHGAPPHTGTRYMHTDHRGDVALVSSSGGDVIARHERRPWGDRGPRNSGTGHAGRAFDGWQRDTGSGLLYAGARYYEAGSGRFLSADPLRQAVYAALAASPLEYVDPGGQGWFRFRVDGRAAFREITPGRYQKVLDSARVHGTDAKFHDDVYVAEGAPRLWDDSIFDGWMRRDVRDLEIRQPAVTRYIASRNLGRARARHVRRKITDWVSYHTRDMLEGPGELARTRASETASSSRQTSPGPAHHSTRVGTGRDLPATRESRRSTGMRSNTTSFTAIPYPEPLRGPSSPSAMQPVATSPQRASSADEPGPGVRALVRLIHGMGHDPAPGPGAGGSASIFPQRRAPGRGPPGWQP